MAAIDAINDRLMQFKNSGLIADFEIVVADDSIRARVQAPRGQNAAKVKEFVVDSLEGLLSGSQVSVEESAGS